MSDTELEWAGLVLGGDSPYGSVEVKGWDDLPDVSDMSEARIRGDGEHVGDLHGRARVVTVTGEVVDRVNRDQLVRALQAATPVSRALADLTVTMFGQPLTARARVVARSIKVDRFYTVGYVPFTVVWRCPDPLRYGPATSPSTGLPTSGGGLTYPLAYPLTYGAAGAAGQLVLDNTSGTADVAVVFAVTGSLPLGFEVSAAGRRLTYPVAVPAGQTVVLNTGDGSVLIDGTADRRGNLTNADWIQVPAGEALTVQFTSLGGTYDPAATLTAVGFRAGSW